MDNQKRKKLNDGNNEGDSTIPSKSKKPEVKWSNRLVSRLINLDTREKNQKNLYGYQNTGFRWC